MGGHDRVDARRDRRTEGHQLDSFQALAVDADHGTFVVTIRRGVPMARKVLRGSQHAALSRALDVGPHHSRHELRVFTVGADVDDRIGRVVVDVGHRGESPVNSQGTSLSGGYFAGEARRRLRAARSDSHGPRQGNGAFGNAKGHAPFDVGRHQ